MGETKIKPNLFWCDGVLCSEMREEGFELTKCVSFDVKPGQVCIDQS